jgi:hypothetical protein
VLGRSLAAADVAHRMGAGVGNLLAQQLIAAGGRVLDVSKLAARVRLLDSGQINKTN